MKIITQNCFGIGLKNNHKRFQLISNMIVEKKPDLVLLQEVIFPFQVRYFENIGYRLFYEKKRFYIKGGLLTLVRKDVYPTYWKYEAYSNQGKLFSRQILERFITKGFLIVTLKDGQKIINTHFLCTYSDSFTADKNQKNQLGQLLNYVKKTQNVIIGGDFNIHEGSIYYQEFVNRLIDNTKNMGFSYFKRKTKFDYIFSSNLITLDKKYIIYPGKVYPSDHKGIFITF